MSLSFPTNESFETRHQERRRGKLKVFLGYAAGVGKTYRMLEEGQQLKRQGLDVVVGYFEPHGRKSTISKSEGLEFVPRRTIAYRGSTFEEMDTPAILERRPAICLVDELAHTNVPGSERSKRWEDEQVLLEAGIDVLTTLNIQHLESLNDQIFQISGVRVRETVPDWFVKKADEVVMVDATSGALLNRLKRGDIYAPEKAQRAMENFFKESTLAALRELALRHTALELESREKGNEYPSLRSDQHQTDETLSNTSAPSQDRILIYLTPETSTAMLIRRGRRMADYLVADCLAVYVCPEQDVSGLPKEQREAIEKHLNFARNLQIETRILQEEDAARALVEFARRNQITQILLSRPRFNWWTSLFGTDLILQVVRNANDMRVIIVAERGRRP
jgi:two-component system, OmpR family, sensor histidine kinase KdpD